MKLRLGTKITIIVIVMFTVLSGVAIFGSYKTHTETMDRFYKERATNIAKTAASQLDGDKLDQYRTTLQKDGQYDGYMQFLKDVKRSNSGCKYLYVQYSANDVVTFLFDTDDSQTACALGDTVANEMGNGMDLEKYEYDALPAFISNGEFGWLCTGMTIVKNSAGENSALVGADIDMNDVMAERHQFLLNIVLIELAITALMAANMLYIVRKGVVNPVNELADATTHFVERREEGGSSISSLHIQTGDEIQRLGESVQTMERNINQYIENLTIVTAEKERIGAELDVASAIQTSMLPSIFPSFPKYERFEVFATMDPAKEVGGDFYDFFFVDENHFAMIIADVSGKGVPAALVMVITKALLKDQMLAGNSPADAMTAVNSQLYESNDEGMFITVWAAVVELSTGRMQYANAGHNAPLLLHGDGSVEWLKKRSGFVLAGLPDTKYKAHELNIACGDTLYLYTDGVTEATDTQDQLYGEDRLISALQNSAHLSPEALLNKVKADVNDFVGNAAQFDDITMLGFRLFWHFKEQTFAAVEESLSPATDFVKDCLEQANCPPKTATQMAVAMDELLTNIVHYSGSQDMTVRCYLTNAAARVIITDNGTPFDPRQMPMPDTTLPVEERPIGGLGILISQKLMDRLDYAYHNQKNTILLEKGFQ